MRPGEQIAQFGVAVDAALASLKGRLPEDLIVSRVSDQPQQVKESVDLFMQSLFEAIGLVIVVALVGFWEWRSAALIAVSIPLTLALTFGGMLLLGLDIQQVSLASLIIALGLLVDDPVVAGDAIRRELDEGTPRGIAAWLGPTKLANAILFATITNIVAYLPLLLVSGFGAHRVLELERGLHVLELADDDRTAARAMARVRVAVAPLGDISASKLRQALRDALHRADQPNSVVRRYRSDAAPLVRDVVGGWRSGRLDAVLRGDFDLIAASRS